MAKPRSPALLASLVSLTTLALACASKFQIDQGEYCKDVNRASDPSCTGAGNSSTGGNNGNDGGGGSAGVTGMGGGGGDTIGGGGGAGGGDPKCAEGLTACGDECFDFRIDPIHCGDCLHDCGGSTCELGACTPEAVISGEVAPYALVQDKSSLFWASPARISDGSLPHRLRAGSKTTLAGAAIDLFPNTLIRSTSLAVAPDEFLYWGSLGSSPTDTGAQRIARGKPGPQDGTPILSGEFNVQYLALSPSKRIYWTVENDAAVRGAPVDGVGGVDLEISTQGKVGWVAVDEDEQPYWIRKDTGEVRRRKAGTPDFTNEFEPVAKSTTPISVELGNGRVYWADRSLGTINSAPKNQPGSSDFEFQGKGPVEGFALDGTTLFVLTLVDGAEGAKVLQVWRQNSRPEPLLMGQVAVRDAATYTSGNPFGAAYVLADQRYIYFADIGRLTGQSGGVSLSAGDGVIYRVAK